MMNPDDIELSTTTRMFSYEKLARDIDKIDDIKVMRDVAKSYIKLYLKQEETISSLGKMV